MSRRVRRIDGLPFRAVFDEADESRDLAGLRVPMVGSLVATESKWEPFRLLDPVECAVDPVAAFFADLLAAGRTEATIRSLKVPDTDRNRRWLGHIRYRMGFAGYPTLRLMTLVETGTRGLLGATLGAADDRDEATQARRLLPLLGTRHAADGGSRLRRQRLLRRDRADRGALAGSHQVQPQPARIGLDPITRWALQFRRRHHHTPDPRRGQLRANPNPVGPASKATATGAGNSVNHSVTPRIVGHTRRREISPVTVSNPHPTMDRASRSRPTLVRSVNTGASRNCRCRRGLSRGQSTSTCW